MSQRPARRIFVLEAAESKDGSSAITSIGIRLDRGGVQCTPYDRLAPSRRKEWDAFEETVTRLAQGRHLYISGRFDHLPNGLQTVVVRQERRGVVVGMCRVPAKSDLHQVLVGNRGNWLGYLVTDRLLSPDEGTRIAAMASASGMMNEKVFALCPNAYCGIEDGDDFDAFDLRCRTRDAPDILAIVRSVFEELSIEL